MLDQLRNDLRSVAARFEWPRERVLEVGGAIRRAIEAGDQAALASFAREYSWRRQATSENDPAINRRSAMPQVAAWFDEVRAVFGEVRVTFAMEGGVVVGQRSTAGNEVAASAMVIRPPEQAVAISDTQRGKRR
ncbi:MAG: hypothetical protein HZC22_13305 [Rhodocyclales bacterium]|nr:hypothetical protein [Rhodocyclales bacterium]